jgi:hypothetical protein
MKSHLTKEDASELLLLVDELRKVSIELGKNINADVQEHGASYLFGVVKVQNDFIIKLKTLVEPE